MPTGDLDNDSFKEMIAVKIRDRLEGLATELVETVNDTMTNAIERIMVQVLLHVSRLSSQLKMHAHTDLLLTVCMYVCYSISQVMKNFEK
jgi:hypothetical protein